MQLVSESVKIKQEQSSLLSRKQVSTAQLQQSKTSLESLKMRITQSEDQVAFCLFLSCKRSNLEVFVFLSHDHYVADESSHYGSFKLYPRR